MCSDVSVFESYDFKYCYKHKVYEFIIYEIKRKKVKGHIILYYRI